MTDLAHKLQQLIALGECPCKSHTWSHWDTVLSEAVEIIKRLPVTANGVPVVPLVDMVWHPYIDGPMLVWLDRSAISTTQTVRDSVRVVHCYSTPEEAGAARRGADDDN
jgi:hypothetical protein